MLVSKYYSTSYYIRPDLVLVSTDSMVLLELSMVTNTWHHFLVTRNHKKDCYGSDLQRAGFSVDLMTVEVGCLWPFHASDRYKT